MHPTKREEEQKGKQQEPHKKSKKKKTIVMDLGCNSGLVTVLLASSQTNPPAKIVGVDIDASLVKKANELVQQRVAFLAKARGGGTAGGKSSPSLSSSSGLNAAAAAAAGSMKPRLISSSRPMVVPVSSIASLPSPPNAYVFGGDRGTSGSSTTTGGAGSKSSSSSSAAAAAATAGGGFPANISFVCSELLDFKAPAGSVDVVLCLSVTKWCV